MRTRFPTRIWLWWRILNCCRTTTFSRFGCRLGKRQRSESKLMPMRWQRSLIVALFTMWVGTALVGLGQLLAQQGGDRAHRPETKNRKLSPQERKELLERYRRFKQLPPEEQERLRRRQREFESLPEEQKEQLRRREKFSAISRRSSKREYADFISAGKTFHPKGGCVLPSGCVACKTYLPWNASAPWTGCHFGVGSTPPNGRLFWISSNACLIRTDLPMSV